MHFAQHADPQQVKAAAAVGALVLLYLAVRTAWTAVFVIMACFASLAFAAYLAKWVLSKDEGTADMQEVSDAIREGADGFFATQYNLIGKLGQGSVGQVYLAERIDLSRQEAIKVLKPIVAVDPHFVSRFRREARAINRLQQRGHQLHVSEKGERTQPTRCHGQPPEC